MSFTCILNLPKFQWRRNHVDFFKVEIVVVQRVARIMSFNQNYEHALHFQSKSKL